MVVVVVPVVVLIVVITDIGVLVKVVFVVVVVVIPDTVLAPVLVKSVVVFPMTASVVMTCSRVGNIFVTVELSFVVKIVSIAGSVVNGCVGVVLVVEVLIPLVVAIVVVSG